MNKIVTLFLALIFSVLAFAGEIPKPTGHVNDYANVLSASEKQSLESSLRAYKDSTSNEIAIFIESSSGDEEPFTRSVDIAENWGVGGEQNDNGILVYVAIADRKMFIQIGRGLEGAIPDALAGRIIDYEIKPHFKEGRYYEGLAAGTEALAKAAAGEYKAKPKKKSGKGIPVWMLILFGIFLLIFIFGGRRMRGKGFGTYGRGGYIGGGWGGWSGGGGFGGSGGGGFGGFGGGSFGGGGAGGSW